MLLCLHFWEKKLKTEKKQHYDPNFKEMTFKYVSNGLELSFGTF